MQFHYNNAIVIEVDGGVVQDVLNVPDGVEYIIVDTDNCPDAVYQINPDGSVDYDPGEGLDEDGWPLEDGVLVDGEEDDEESDEEE